MILETSQKCWIWQFVNDLKDFLRARRIFLQSELWKNPLGFGWAFCKTWTNFCEFHFNSTSIGCFPKSWTKSGRQWGHQRKSLGVTKHFERPKWVKIHSHGLMFEIVIRVVVWVYSNHFLMFVHSTSLSHHKNHTLMKLFFRHKNWRSQNVI